MARHEGGCLCGTIRYVATAPPKRITICHCRFCQRATGSAYLVEPIFERDHLQVIGGKPKTYGHRSEGSGKVVTINFCDGCGTKIFLEFERFPEVVGIYGGTFDEPDWFEKTPHNTKHIFLGVAQHGTVIPAGFNTFLEHAMLADGTPAEPRILETPFTVGD